MWGCFRCVEGQSARRPGLPHACGGVSSVPGARRSGTMSSPRMWGCFLRSDSSNGWRQVFPTHVGVFPIKLPPPQPPIRLPHACGGVSMPILKRLLSSRSSPRMWGCFSNAVCWPFIAPVFPTHVGVFPDRALSERVRVGLPHACGGVSAASPVQPGTNKSSPRMWGCFFGQLKALTESFVFPTHVGVFPILSLATGLAECLPHACGGVSPLYGSSTTVMPSSPRMWGCFHKLN